MDVMTAAFREYAGVELKKKQVKKPSVRKKLQKAVQRKAKHRQRVKQRQKSEGRNDDAGEITEGPDQEAGDLESPISYLLCGR